MNAMVARSALLSVLVIAATGPITEAAGPYDTTTERFHCYRIRAGDSAADVAEHLTGHRGNLSGSLFQIFDSHRQLVSKDHYDRISPGWTVCLAEGRSPIAIRTASPAKPAASVQPLEPTIAELLPTFYDSDVWWFASLVLVATTSLFALNSWRKQRALAHIMQRFGGDFVREFGRPWTQYRGARALPRARLRINPRQARVEILLAPSPGRTYPNLSDHRGNVEYDVARITAALKHAGFASVQPYAEGEWVVLPFQFNGRVNQEGDR
jgi:hypothetical protein